MSTAINVYEISMAAKGYTNDRAQAILIRAQAGEEIHPFHNADYDTHNMPAEKNGLENDTICIRGKIQMYVEDGSKKNCTYGFIAADKDGNRWLALCASKTNGNYIGKLWGSEPEKHVFESYEDCDAELYGKYMGFSEKYKLPVIDIMTYGGMRLIEENTLVMTMTSEHNMQAYGGIYDFKFLLGAEDCIESIERYR